MTNLEMRLHLTASALAALIRADGGIYSVPAESLAKKAVQLADAALLELQKDKP